MPVAVADINELKQRAAKHVEDARTLHTKAESEDRGFTAEEQEQWDRLMDAADDLKQRADTAWKQVQAERSIIANKLDEDTIRKEERQLERRGYIGETPPGDEEIRSWRPELAGAYSQVHRAHQGDTEEYRTAFFQYLRTGRPSEQLEYRALQADDAEAGGFTVPPQWSARLIKFVDDMVHIRQRATVETITSGTSLGVPSLDADPEDGTWTSEVESIDRDTQMDFGGRELTPHLVAKELQVSNKLIRASGLSVDRLVRERLGYKIGVTLEKAYLTGTGAQQPLGLFTASANGISTSADVSTDNTSTAVTLDGLIEAKYSLKQQYWRNAVWIGHRDLAKQVRKIKDGEGRYIWQESIRAGEPDVLMNAPFLMSEFAPNTFTASQYVAIYGDLSFYWIVDAMNMTVQVLLELYARTSQRGYIIRAESDGMPVLEEAFARVTLAA